VRDSEEKGPDGITLKNRMSGLMRLIVNDIRECKDKWKNKGFACMKSLSMKKAHHLTQPTAQMLRSKAYFERRFAGYVEKFRDYKNNIRQVLAGHLALKKVQRLNDDPDDLTVSDNNETELVALIDNHLSSDPGLMFDADVASEPVKKIETKANSSLDPHIATGSNRCIFASVCHHDQC
jgi:hypothetical protein